MQFRESEQSQSFSFDAFCLVLNQFGLPLPKSISNLKFIMNSTKEPFEKTNEYHYRIQTFCTMQIQFGVYHKHFLSMRLDLRDSICSD